MRWEEGGGGAWLGERDAEPRRGPGHVQIEEDGHEECGDLKVEEQLHLLPSKKDAKIVLYCMSGRMSEIAADTLVQRRYTNLWNLDGGMIAWEKAGYPVIKGAPK